MSMTMIDTLARSEGFPRVSLYLPTHPTWPDCEQDPIRLANAVREAERQLVNAGVRSTEAADLLAAANGRGKDDIFWRYQDAALAVFIEPGSTRWLRLPATTPEISAVGEHYHVRPLIPILRDRGDFHVLAATREAVHLFNATTTGMREVAIEGAPQGVSALRAMTRLPADVGYHSRSSGEASGGATAPRYAALGESPEDYDAILFDEYTQAIASAVDAQLAETTTPLVLAASPRMLGRLRSFLDYPHLLPTAVDVDPQSLDEASLHRRALAIAEPLLLADRTRQRERLRTALESDSTLLVREIDLILRAAGQGRVDAAFLAEDQIIRGFWNEEYRVSRLAEPQETGGEDLLNLVALRVLAQRGDVRVMPADLSDRIGPAAALLRY